MGPPVKGQPEAHWQLMQKRTFTRYINSKLKSRSLCVEDLYEDVKTGIILYNFLEVLTGQSLKKYGKMNTGKMRIQHVANQNVVFKFFPDADIKPPEDTIFVAQLNPSAAALEGLSSSLEVRRTMPSFQKHYSVHRTNLAKVRLILPTCDEL